MEAPPTLFMFICPSKCCHCHQLSCSGRSFQTKEVVATSPYTPNLENEKERFTFLHMLQSKICKGRSDSPDQLEEMVNGWEGLGSNRCRQGKGRSWLGHSLPPPLFPMGIGAWPGSTHPAPELRPPPLSTQSLQPLVWLWPLWFVSKSKYWNSHTSPCLAMADGLTQPMPGRPWARWMGQGESCPLPGLVGNSFTPT